VIFYFFIFLFFYISISLRKCYFRSYTTRKCVISNQF